MEASEGWRATKDMFLEFRRGMVLLGRRSYRQHFHAHTLLPVQQNSRYLHRYPPPPPLHSPPPLPFLAHQPTTPKTARWGRQLTTAGAWLTLMPRWSALAPDFEPTLTRLLVTFSAALVCSGGACRVM